MMHRAHRQNYEEQINSVNEGLNERTNEHIRKFNIRILIGLYASVPTMLVLSFIPQ